jgi:hypothetical protein
MARPPYALILVLAVAWCGAAEGQASLAPEAGVLVLRNGQVLDGDVTRAGDHYIVTKGVGSELWIKADEVEAFCGSLGEAYEFKVRHLSGLSAKAHIELAQWCLRHGLFEKCSVQLDAAAQMEPSNTQIKDLRTRLALATESAPPPTAPKSTAIFVSADELEKTIRELPKGSVEKFGAIVQPILLNRCGANQCHGPNGPSEFRLLRPPAGQIVSRRFTQRNLHAAVRYLDSSNAEASPLIVKPQQRHGNSLAAVFDKHSAHQLAELVGWAKMTIAPGAKTVASAPASIVPTETTLSQPATPAPATDQSALPPPGVLEGVRVMRPQLDPSGRARVPAESQPPSPRDRFDPELFNRHYHGK